MKTFRLIVSVLFCFLPLLVLAQQYESPESVFKAYSIEDVDLGTIHFYVSSNNLDSPKPLLLYMDGSGPFPLFSIIKRAQGYIYSSTVPFDYNSLSKDYHVVLISKPGVPFVDSLPDDSMETYFSKYRGSEEYHSKLSLQWRAESASVVINFLLKNIPVEENRVFVLGISEGAQVAPKLAAINSSVQKIACLVGSGLNQFFDFINNERIKALKGEITHIEAQENIDKLMQQYSEIYSNPLDTDKFWYGHTYKRWASFCGDIVLENMLSLNIPILAVVAAADTNSPIAGLDYIPLEFMRKGKTNLTYTVYPNYTHSFTNLDTGENEMQEVVKKAVHWLGN